MKRVVIVGATSGIGMEIAKDYLKEGCLIGVAGRREELLASLKTISPEKVFTERINVVDEEAQAALLLLIEKLGGMDLFILTSGIGSSNYNLKPEIELETARTNTEGFMRMTTAAFNYFSENGGGHIAVISSIAGTKGLGIAPAYSATKRFQSHYIDALSQLSRMRKLRIRFTDIRPGFVDTALLKKDKYPMLMKPEVVARKIVKAVNRGRRRMVVDVRYRMLVFVWKLVPLWLWERLPIK